MYLVAHISFRNSYPGIKILTMRVWRYLQTAYLLHLITVLAIYLCIYFAKETIAIIKNSNDWKELALFIYLTLYTFTLPFFSQLDAFSRYQNYKMIKDKIYEYGFDSRIIKPFLYSRCQRDAISVAICELNYSSEWKSLIYKMGFRWYHLLPHLIFNKPSVLFTRQYWIKTFFAKPYYSKYFLW